MTKAYDMNKQAYEEMEEWQSEPDQLYAIRELGIVA